ncbi:hypothetical protein ACQP2K_17560 [Microbispora siamensis]
MPESGIITDLPQRIASILQIEPEWTVQEDDRLLGFVAGETGVLLAVGEGDDWASVLRVEARLARHVPDDPH